VVVNADDKQGSAAISPKEKRCIIGQRKRNIRKYINDIKHTHTRHKQLVPELTKQQTARDLRAWHNFALCCVVVVVVVLWIVPVRAIMMTTTTMMLGQQQAGKGMRMRAQQWND